MTRFNISTLSQNAFFAAVASVAIVALTFMGFFMAEPIVSYSQVDTDVFTVSQIITGENSLIVSSSSVTTVGSIAGLTGGNATGTTSFVVTSNNSGGYYVDLAFDNNAGAYAMYGETTQSESIRDYTTPGFTSTTTYDWTSSSSALFGYTVTSSTTLDTSNNFLDNGTFCGAGGVTQTDGKCWRTPTVAAYEIVNRDSAAPTGASTTLTFKVEVPSGAVPTVVTDTYTATATLSLYLQ